MVRAPDIKLLIKYLACPKAAAASSLHPLLTSHYKVKFFSEERSSENELTLSGITLPWGRGAQERGGCEVGLGFSQGEDVVYDRPLFGDPQA